MLNCLCTSTYTVPYKSNWFISPFSIEKIDGVLKRSRYACIIFRCNENICICFSNFC